jgi:hypothetical protein
MYSLIQTETNAIAIDTTAMANIVGSRLTSPSAGGGIDCMTMIDAKNLKTSLVNNRNEMMIAGT